LRILLRREGERAVHEDDASSCAVDALLASSCPPRREKDLIPEPIGLREVREGQRAKLIPDSSWNSYPDSIRSELLQLDVIRAVDIIRERRAREREREREGWRKGRTIKKCMLLRRGVARFSRALGSSSTPAPAPRRCVNTEWTSS